MKTISIKTILGSRLIQAVLASVLATLIILGIAAGALWHYRADVFKYFASEYARTIVSNTSSAERETALSSVPLPLPSAIATLAPSSSQSDIEGAVEKANPAVVAITVSKNVPKYITSYQNVSPFEGVTFQIPSQVQDGYEKRQIGAGSGFLVSADGMVMTNRHVVEDKDAEYTITLTSGKKYTASVLARDPLLDIAFLKIQTSALPYLSLGDSDTLKLGQSVIAIGNALGQFQNTVSVGIVSGLSRSIVAGGAGASESLDHVIQTDAAINPGNSGGPLLDLSGTVVGVNVAIVQGSQNIGFALPINSIKGALASVRQSGKIVRPYVGIRYTQITPELQSAKDLPVGYGALIAKGPGGEAAILPNSPAEKAGLMEGDIILKLNGIKLDGSADFAAIIRDKHVGDAVTLQVLSKGVTKTVTVYLAVTPQA